MQAGFFQKRSYAAGLIVHQENLRRGGIGIQYPAYHTIGGNDGHAFLNALTGTLINKDRTRLLAATGADDLRSNRFGNEFLFEPKQRLQASCLLGVIA